MFVRPLKRVQFDFRFSCLNSWVFFERKTLGFFQLALEPCGRTAEKKSVGPKLAVLLNPDMRKDKIDPRSVMK